MPLPAESLTPDSDDAAVKAAISASIAQCVREGGKQDQCVAMAYSMVAKSTGRSAGGGAKSRVKAGLEKK